MGMGYIKAGRSREHALDKIRNKNGGEWSMRVSHSEKESFITKLGYIPMYKYSSCVAIYIYINIYVYLNTHKPTFMINE